MPSDHAFKTMTMEAFPHSGQQLASVHPCKHASVMKKFIDRMDDAQAAASGTRAPEASVTGKEKKKWGLGGMVRKVTGGVQASAGKDKEPTAGSNDHVESGLQVDFYLVIVSRARERNTIRTLTAQKFLKFIASIVPTIEVCLTSRIKSPLTCNQVDSTTAF